MLKTLVMPLLAALALAACSASSADLTLRDPQTGFFVTGCGIFDPYNSNMTVATLDGRFPRSGGESAAISRGSDGGFDGDCGLWGDVPDDWADQVRHGAQ